MSRNIKVEQLNQTPIEKQEIEIVERKGIGHPDSMCDGIAESVSHALANQYIKKFGTILHHNTDQVELVAGRSLPKFGGGEIISPIYILLSGRATRNFKEVEIPVNMIAISAAKKYLKDFLPDINPENVIIDCKIGEGSTDLQNVFTRGKIPMANDTSFGVGHAPRSELENIVYNVERQMIYKFKKEVPAIGPDIKVMGVRKGNQITLTVACAMIGKHIDDQNHYFSIKDELENKIFTYAKTFTNRSIEVFVNTGDDRKTGSVYLTVMGTSSENGDDGSVGRGNRCNGLITPNRPMSMEATAGKNCVSHVGKIYNLLSNEIAHNIVSNVSGIEEVYIRILSQIGHPIDEPLIASAQILVKEGYDFNIIKFECENIINEGLKNITDITEMLVYGGLDTF